MGSNPSRDTQILIDYSSEDKWRARLVKANGRIEPLIEGAQSIESVTKYVWRLSKDGKL